jgi:hypothetical protein
MRSAEVVTRTGVTYRQLDYWSRLGLFGFKAAPGMGSGAQRDWEDHQVVLVRALVLISQMSHPAFNRFAIEPLVLSAWLIDPDLNGWWLVCTPGAVEVTQHVPAVAALLLVDLGACAQVLRAPNGEDAEVA